MAEILYNSPVHAHPEGGGTGPSTGSYCTGNRHSEARRRPGHPAPAGYCKIRGIERTQIAFSMPLPLRDDD